MKTVTILSVLALAPLALAQSGPDIDVQKSVNNTSPAANEPVEFTVVVSNTGDQAAADVVVIDQLPDEMQMPGGTAAFVSVGDYDEETGRWTIGELLPGAQATLVMPAVITSEDPPACVVNTAVSTFVDGFNDNNDSATAAIYQVPGSHCVDLTSFPNVRAGTSIFPSCDRTDSYNGTIEVRNAGPDSARDVSVTVSQTPLIGAGIRFDDPRCLQSGSATCDITEVAANETLLLNITSDTFQNYTDTSHHLSVSVGTTDIDYQFANDLIETDAFVHGFSNCDESLQGNFFGGEIGPDPCFIATAAYGSPLDPHLDSLRGFRDRFLLTNAVGRHLVSFYYRYSPPIANFIADRDWLRALVRAILTPIIFAIEYPAPASLCLLSLIAVLRGLRRRQWPWERTWQAKHTATAYS